MTDPGFSAEFRAMCLAIDIVACHTAVVIAPTSRMEQIRATMLRLYWDLRPLAEHSVHVDAALDVIACADCGEEDTLDLERVERRLEVLRKLASAPLQFMPGIEPGEDPLNRW
jgi:hypothetical protein